MIGIDEVGRGCWAGPLLVVAARQKTRLPEGLNDSKILTQKNRERLAPLIEASCDIGEGWVIAVEIDNFGLSKAMRLGVERALIAIKPVFNEEVIIDGDIDYITAVAGESRAISRLKLLSRSQIKGDRDNPVISAASIHAKVRRDNLMRELSLQYPAYGFEDHVGYGTKKHIDALNKLGVSDLHRLSYKPVKAVYDAAQSTY